MKTRVLVALVILLNSFTGPLPLNNRAASPEPPPNAAPNPARDPAMAAAMAAPLTSDQAAIAAVNNWETTTDGWRLRHPRHTATFTSDGVQFSPRQGGLEWAWRLTFVGAGDAPLKSVSTDSAQPAHIDQSASYSRGGLVEQYLAKGKAIEQQFIIPQSLPLNGADLVIAGAVVCAGVFEETADGWRWRAGNNAIHLGDVRVYDAAGRTLPARMAVTAEATRIVVDGGALARAAYPVTVDPEIGGDVRLSSMGADGNADYDALTPAVAYNSTDNQYLVVWSGSDSVVGEYEIWGQRVNAATGAQIGADAQISFMGPADDPAYDAEDPDVTYNSQTNEYLVVWSGDHYADGDFEVFARRVNASTGALIGSVVRVSVMGPGTDPNYDARSPAVAYNSADNQYLVVWEGDDNTSSLVDDEFEIWAKRLSASAEWVDADNRRMSDMGGTGDAAYDAYDPDVAYNSADNQYLIVWEGDDTAAGLVDDEFEIWGQRVNSALSGLGSNDFRISSVGPDGNADYDAGDPAIVYNNLNNQYLVVWEGEGAGVDMYDIVGQRLGAGGTLVGEDFHLSNPGDGPNGSYDAVNPAVAYDQANNEYLVVWQDDELGVGEYEIWGQRVNAATGAAVGMDTRLSDMGADGNADLIAQTPAAAYSKVSHNQYLVVWSGDNSTDGEFEIWGQRFTSGYKVYLPIVIK